MRKRTIALAIAGLVSFAAAAISPATPRPPLGTAQTTVSLFSVEGNLGGVPQSVGLTVGSSFATTDPAQTLLGFNRAAIDVILAELKGQITKSLFPISTEAQGPGNDSKSDAERSESFDYGDALSGSLVVGARSAEVGEGFAAANLGQVLLDAEVLNGLVRLEGVTIMGVAAESNLTTAFANQGVTIDEISIFSLGQLFDQLGTSLTELSVDSLLGLADATLADAGAPQALRDAIQDVTDAEQAVTAAGQALTAAGQALYDASQAIAAAEGEVQSALGETEETSKDAAALEGAIADLTDGGIACITDSCDEDAMAIGTILTLAQKYGVAAVGDPLTIAAATSVAIAAAHAQAQSRLAAAQAALAAAQSAFAAAEAALAASEAALAAVRAQLDAALAALQPVRKALEGTIAEKSLVTLRNVAVEVAAQAFDTDAVSSARITFGSAEVVGREILVDNLVAAAAALEAQVDDVMASISDALEEVGLIVTADLDFPTSNFSSGTDSGYQVASSELSAFGITVSAGPSGDGPGALSSAPEVTLRANVLSLTANASHMAGEKEDPLPNLANLSVIKSDGVTSVVAGDGLTRTYKITITNAGPSDAESVTLADTWPAGFTRATVTPSQGSCDTTTDPGSFTCALGTIVVGASATVTASYTVPDSTTTDQTNTAMVSSTTPDPDTGDNTAVDTNVLNRSESNSDNDSEVEGSSQTSSGNNTGQPASGNDPQGGSGDPESNPGAPGGSQPNLPKTGVETGLFLLLAYQLIMLGWALERYRPRPNSAG